MSEGALGWTSAGTRAQQLAALAKSGEQRALRRHERGEGKPTHLHLVPTPHHTHSLCPASKQNHACLGVVLPPPPSTTLPSYPPHALLAAFEVFVSWFV